MSKNKYFRLPPQLSLEGFATLAEPPLPEPRKTAETIELSARTPISEHLHSSVGRGWRPLWNHPAQRAQNAAKHTFSIRFTQNAAQHTFIISFMILVVFAEEHRIRSTKSTYAQA